jgi:8-oxo-dGTP pyrophosphatase MutT (NUDIX family)
MIWRPSVTVAAVIERDGKFLCVEEMIDGRRVLNQPAGHLDPGESLAAGCAREVLEETAHRVTPKALIGIYRWHLAPKDVTFLRFCFACSINSFEKERKLDKEIVAAHWLTLEELKTRKAEHRSPLVLKCVEDFLGNKRYPLDVFSPEYS